MKLRVDRANIPKLIIIFSLACFLGFYHCLYNYVSSQSENIILRAATTEAKAPVIRHPSSLYIRSSLPSNEGNLTDVVTNKENNTNHLQGLLPDPDYYHIPNNPPASLLLSPYEERVLRDRPKKNRLAIVSFYDADTMEMVDQTRDSYLPLLSYRECYCLKWGYDCHVELQALDKETIKNSRIHYNKQLTMRKYLPFYDWVLFADADTAFWMDKRIEDIMLPNKTIYFQSNENSVSCFRAAMFLMKNAPASYQFLEEWYNYSRDAVQYVNADNGVLHLVLLNKVPTYNGSCLKYFKDKVAYEQGKAKKCVASFLQEDLGEISINAQLFVPNKFRNAVSPGHRLGIHGKTLAREFVKNTSAIYDCIQYL